MVELSSQFIIKNEFDMDMQDAVNLNATERKCGEIILLANNTKFWFVCSFCDERFHSIIIFRKHIKALHITDTENDPYIKSESPLDVPSNEEMHIIECNPDLENVTCYSQNDDVESNSNLILEPISDGTNKCNLNDGEISEYCNNEFENNIQNDQCDYYEIEEILLTNDHKLTVRNIKEGIESIPNSENVRNRENEPIICKSIEDLLPTESNVKRKRKRRSKVYSCDFCEHIGRDKISLEAHMRSKHGTGTRHQCEECGKFFRNAHNLRTHMIIHTGERPFKCEFCGTGFSHPNNLKTHRYIHTGERPYKCDQCDRGFIAPTWLRIHMRDHTGEKPYVCNFCGKGFASKSSYKKHMISHAGRRIHGCTLCEKSFVHKETLRKHMVCHANEKKFACERCPKKFNHKKNLVQHEKLHSNVKAYICEICNKDFKQSAGLYSHMRHHKKKE